MAERTPVGKAIVIGGCMFSGKTDELIRRMKIYKQQPGLVVTLVRPERDTRSRGITTHMDSFGLRSSVDALCCKDLEELREVLFASDVIGIDECQFLPGSASLIRELVIKGKIVIVAMLTATFEQKPWPNSPLPELMCFAKFKSTTAVCNFCGCPGATCSYRRNTSKELVQVGAKDSYLAACLACYDRVTAPPVMTEGVKE
jgi:thymidine kinase